MGYYPKRYKLPILVALPCIQKSKQKVILQVYPFQNAIMYSDPRDLPQLCPAFLLSPSFVCLFRS